MRVPVIISSLLLLQISLQGQDTITVAEKAVKIGIMATETEYYGFAAGDKLIFTYYAENGKELKDITITEYPTTVRFSDHNIVRIDKKVIEIPKKGIYQFDYYNSNIIPRTVNIKIQRLPHDASTKSFNTNVKWINVTDTTYKGDQETLELKTDTTIEEVYNSPITVAGNFAKDNATRKATDFSLPAGTIRWVYWIGAGQEAKNQFEADRKSFAGNGSKDPLSGFAMGSNLLTKITDGKKIRYYFISAPEEVQHFTDGISFKFFKQGEAVADYGIMNYYNKAVQRYSLALRNDNPDAVLDVQVKILAVVVNKNYKNVSQRIPVYTNRRIPVHEQ